MPLHRTQNIIAQTMADKFGPLFTPDMQLTFIARSTDKPDCYMVITSDDLDEVVGAIRRHQGQPDDDAVKRAAEAIKPLYLIGGAPIDLARAALSAAFKPAATYAPTMASIVCRKCRKEFIAKIGAVATCSCGEKRAVSDHCPRCGGSGAETDGTHCNLCDGMGLQ